MSDGCCSLLGLTLMCPMATLGIGLWLQFSLILLLISFSLTISTIFYSENSNPPFLETGRAQSRYFDYINRRLSLCFASAEHWPVFLEILKKCQFQYWWSCVAQGKYKAKVASERRSMARPQISKSCKHPGKTDPDLPVERKKSQ